MEDESIPNEKLTKELDEMKKKIAKLEVSEDMHKWIEAKLQREGYEKVILLDHAPVMIYWLDSEGKFIIVNKCFADFFNKSHDDIEGRYLYDLYSEEMADKIYAENVEIMESERPKYGIEESFQTRNGETRWMRSDKVPYKDTDGKVKGVIGVLFDITEQRARFREIEDSEEKFKTIVERSYDIIVVTNERGICTYVSPSIERVLGHRPEEIIGKYFQILFPDNMNKKVERMWSALIQGKEIEGVNLEIIGKNLGEVIVEVNGLSIMKDEKVEGIQLHLRNITVRKLEEEMIEKEKNKFQRYIDVAGIILKIVDSSGKVSLINNRGCEVLGYTREEIVGKNWIDNFLPERLQDQMTDIFEKLRSRKTVAYEHLESPILTVNGEERIISWNNTVLKDERGGFQGILSSGEDVTTKSKVKRELQENYQKLQHIMEDTVYTMAKVVEKKDPYSAGHQKRVSQLATAIAKEMKLPKDKIEGLKVASLVHDIGKIGMPIEILCKPSGLTELGIEIIKEHPMAGYDILEEIDFPWPVDEIVLQHHERVNGSGYPNGLKGDEILTEAKILCVADVIEAMSSYRAYRPSYSIKEALKELNKNKGILYDSAVVDACKTLFKYIGVKFDFLQ
jgi:PAS domain S-box-containing protein/putative nucleotidyltransferase with HDIG domain